eukprot:scaffold2830_cov131-Cylindrotheca_fusiformis.AAC.28
MSSTREERDMLFEYPKTTSSSGGGRNTRNNNNGIEMYRFDAAKDLSMPTVTLPRRKQPMQRTCGGRIACGMKILIVLIPFYFYRQIVDISLSTDMFSSPAVRNDYSYVRSIHDLNSKKVKQWCKRNVYDCKCKDPMIGIPRESETIWQKAHGSNVDRVSQSMHPDVVFYGDGLVEQWNHQKASAFDEFFSRSAGGRLEGIAMGIAGDTSPNLLWRIQNGEFPAKFRPSVVWIAIGTQDLGTTSCSPEMVIIGVLRIVEEILQRSRSSKVVINAIFPWTFNKDGYVARSGGPMRPSLWDDIRVVNGELKEYSTNRNRVSFFDIANTFLKNPKAPTTEIKIDAHLMDDNFHLTKKGYQQWATHASDRLQKLVVNSTAHSNQDENSEESSGDDVW